MHVRQNLNHDSRHKMFGILAMENFIGMRVKFTKVYMLTLGIAVSGLTLAQDVQKSRGQETNVVYGDKHIFTIETPEGWTNDKPYAQKNGLVNLFFATADSAVKQKSYLYANGYDKRSIKETLEEFIKGDLETYRKKYSNFEFEIINVGFSGGVKNGKLYSFSNLGDRYREEVLYGETNQSIIILSFSATTKDDYEKYRSVFDAFVKSFEYRGDNPKPFLDYLNTKK